MNQLFYRKFTFSGFSKQGEQVKYSFTLINDDVRMTPYRFFKLFDLKTLDLSDDLYEGIMQLVNDEENKLTQRPLRYTGMTLSLKGYTFTYCCRPNVNVFLRALYWVKSHLSK